MLHDPYFGSQRDVQRAIYRVGGRSKHQMPLDQEQGDHVGKNTDSVGSHEILSLR